MSKRVITKYRKLDPCGVEAAKVAPWIAERDPSNGQPRKWILKPVHLFLPGHDWQNDDKFLRLTYRMSGCEVEFSKAWVLNPENKTDAVRMIFPLRLVEREEYRRACILSKKRSVIELKDYLLGLYLEERRRTDRLRVPPEQIMCELENLWLRALREDTYENNRRVERLGKFIWGVRTGLWGQQDLLPRKTKGSPKQGVGSAALEEGKEYSAEELTDFLQGIDSGDAKDRPGSEGVRSPVLGPEEETPD